MEQRDYILLARQWLRQGKKHRKRAFTKLQKREKELQETEKWQWFQQIGDSLLADPEAYPKGEAEREILNVHRQQMENVRLNPKCDAYRNAELYYKKARKGKRGFDAARNKVRDSRSEIENIDEFISECIRFVDAFENGHPFDEEQFQKLSSLAGEFDSAGSKASKGISENHAKVPYRHYQIEDYDVFVGKTDAQNDELSIRFAKSWDIWLHVAGHAGSHVVIRRQKGSQWPSKTVLEKAGALAVWFSKAKHTSYAEVHVTEARFVRKQRKSPPGQVIAERCKTVRVAPLSPHQMFPGVYD